ncbi:UvrD-helicase domain-containing protein [Raoultella ornithinolytica]|uniref:UvrD-helicase domain-containing protein n=1 Tax=Klebsiella/Raoultella group TaxID=2890311 RepID=UPI001265B3A5|nr:MULTISPECIES: UvrD-helicase domain-containing protein [Klebsiella/Raoultella group]EKR9385281.1 ATP-dependent helicase [Raoultella ornithinolytica]KAB8133745.1 ATP-dependent helicase [Raoultella ornithinolytica]MDM4206915.1 UvrD-helicase domain-containing protein [Klebsiella spallanzanii]
MNFKLDQQQAEIEKDVEAQLFKLITNAQSFYFISGAGSGKTHALITGVNKFINSNYTQLISNSQKALCITYTNNASDEIKHRLGDNDLVLTSTIHSYIWDVVKYHMDLLLDEHMIFLNEEIANIHSELYELQTDNPALLKVRDLEEAQLHSIIDRILEDKNKFYESLKSASTFWAYLKTITDENTFNQLKGNYQKLSSVFKKAMKSQEFKTCICKIQAKEGKYTEIRYFNTKNIEVLYKNIIGHDTLLMYSSRLIQKYPLLSKCIIDAHPLIFIDEYQDTDENIINLFLEIHHIAQQENKKICLGFFGDPMQTIYKNNVHVESKNLTKLVKNINRRSHQNIVSCINKIRGCNQDVLQKPIKIYKEKYSLTLTIENEDNYTNEYLSSILDKYKYEWNVSENSKLACLVLKNEMLSQLCGFEHLYTVMLDIYQREHAKGFEMIGSEFLFRELRYAGSLPSLIHDLLMPLYLLKRKSDFSISDLFNKGSIQKHSLSDILDSIKIIDSLDFKCLDDFANKISETYSKQNPKVQELIKYNFDILIEGLGSAKEKIIDTCRFKDTINTQPLLDRLFNLDIEQFFLWLDFIYQNYSDTMISYLTCHASKGLEFDNVIIFLSDSFNRKEGFFSNLLNSDLNSSLDIQLESARRLLYVSSSRAIKNLKIILFTNKEVDESKIQHLLK